jgi:hypothetical protein
VSRSNRRGVTVSGNHHNRYNCVSDSIRVNTLPECRKGAAYRTPLDGLIEMPRIRSAINFTELPAPSTLCKAFDRLDMAVRGVLLDISVSSLPTDYSKRIKSQPLYREAGFSSQLSAVSHLSRGLSYFINLLTDQCGRALRTEGNRDCVSALFYIP